MITGLMRRACVDLYAGVPLWPTYPWQTVVALCDSGLAMTVDSRMTLTAAGIEIAIDELRRRGLDRCIRSH